MYSYWSVTGCVKCPFCVSEILRTKQNKALEKRVHYCTFDDFNRQQMNRYLIEGGKLIMAEELKNRPSWCRIFAILIHVKEERETPNE